MLAVDSQRIPMGVVGSHGTPVGTTVEPRGGGREHPRGTSRGKSRGNKSRRISRGGRWGHEGAHGTPGGPVGTRRIFIGHAGFHGVPWERDPVGCRGDLFPSHTC